MEAAISGGLAAQPGARAVWFCSAPFWVAFAEDDKNKPGKMPQFRGPESSQQDLFLKRRAFFLLIPCH